MRNSDIRCDLGLFWNIMPQRRLMMKADVRVLVEVNGKVTVNLMLAKHT